MNQDARFEDGSEKPLNLGALDGEDLKVLSALVQDAVFPIAELSWQPRARRFALLLNRFRWEDKGQGRHGAERVQSLLVVENVLNVASQGVSRQEKDLILSLLALDWRAGADAEGVLELTLAGDGAIRLEVEALEVQLRDVTRPYKAVSGRTPDHD